MDPFFIIVFGPTGVGKTVYALELGQMPHVERRRSEKIEIINGDMGQLYEPLAIGTAKPDWKNEAIPHHLFDIVKEPVHYSAYDYSQECIRAMRSIVTRGNVPVIVGGTGFYLHSLFFPVQEPEFTSEPASDFSNGSALAESRWELLASIDPLRAQNIHPRDIYRIERALRIWREKGVLPSSLKPVFRPPSIFLPTCRSQGSLLRQGFVGQVPGQVGQTEVPWVETGNCHIIFLDRETEDLYERINRRVEEMMAPLGAPDKRSWIDEVAELPEPWHQFLSKKRLIGYPEVRDFIMRGSPKSEMAQLIATIQQKIRDYARRQKTFWRGFKRNLQDAWQEYPEAKGSLIIEEINLTFAKGNLYSKHRPWHGVPIAGESRLTE